MSEIIQNPWTRLRSFTNARLALGRAGDSLPTDEILEFALAHAQARDAVHDALDTEGLSRDLKASGFEPITVQSAARDRAEYLKRPDMGRRLNDESLAAITNCYPEHFASLRVNSVEGPVLSTNQRQDQAPPIVFIIADGLSATAPARHALPVLKEMVPRLEGWNIAPIIVATQARVALGDEIGELFRAEVTVMLIGERPGLSSPDSLGIYLTYKPHIGCTDAGRNCISNVRPEGLGYEDAARKLHHLMIAARRLGRSGVALKDKSDSQSLNADLARQKDRSIMS